MKARPRTFAITGVTITGNMGGQAMLLATTDQIQNRLPGSSINLFSIYPQKDRAENRLRDVRIIDASPTKLILLYFPLMIVLWPVRKMTIVKKILGVIAYFKFMYESDALLDHSGIAFVDGRGIPLLAYNICCSLPGFFAGIPVIKLSQALGPFNSLINRIAARWVLSKCARVIARGSSSFGFLKRLELENTSQMPDVAFLLDVKERHYMCARNELKRIGIGSPPVIISPSRVVEKSCQRLGIDFRKEMKTLIQRISASGEPVLLLPHSLGEGADKNNDVTLCRDIYGNGGCSGLYILDDIKDARVLRAVISQGKVFIGNRFHSIVSALAELVPLIVIGWSHKYRELVQPFGLDDWVFDYNDFSGLKMYDSFERLKKNLQDVKRQMDENIGYVKQRAYGNYEFLDTN